MAVMELKKMAFLDAPISVESLTGRVFANEQDAHKFIVSCMQNGQPLTLTGTVTAKFVRADGNTVQLVGAVEDGAATVTLAQDCYNVPGRFQLAVFNTVGETTICVYACVGTVQRTQAGNLIDGGEIIDTIEDLIADIQTAVASIPPDYSALVAEVDALKSAFVDGTLGDVPLLLVDNSYVKNTDGTFATYNGWSRTGLIYIGNAETIAITTTARSDYNVFYNSSKAFVSSFVILSGDNEIAIPDGVDYIALSSTTTAMNETTVRISETKADADLVLLNGFRDAYTKELYGYETINATSAMAQTRRWFMNHIFSAGTMIKTLNFRWWTGSAVSRSFLIEIWEKDGDALTKVKTVPVTIQEASAVDAYTVNHVDIGYVSTKPCMICFLATTANTLMYQSTTGMSMALGSTDVTTSTDSLTYSSLTLYTDAKYAISIDYLADDGKNKNVITIGEGMDYTEIQDALNSISDDSASNPYTLLVMPKGTPYKPFTTIRADFSASYPWNNIEPRNISIIGLDKEHCVIQSDSGDYYYPCAEPMINGTIKNLKFIMTIGEQTATAEEGGFCLHIDCRTKDDVGYQMTVEDCDFENASAPCLGVGLHKNCDLKFVRCNFKTTLTADYNPHEGYRNLVDGGAVLSHSSTLATATNQHLSFIDCIGTCVEGNKSIQISNAGDYDPETAYFEYTLIRNVFWNYGLNAAGWSISNNITPSPFNYGNNS